jgi:uncharacterized membrane protein YcaP (DUF421 family)
MCKSMLLFIGLSLPNEIIKTSILAFVLYLAALVILRFGDKRFLGKSAAFDVVLGIIIGSVVSRAINGTAQLLPTLAAIIILVGLHWIFSILSLHSEKISSIVKGNSKLIVKEGEILWDRMRRNQISKSDFMMHLRIDGKLTKIQDIKEAYLERGGRISIIPKKSEPKIVEVKVEKGVETIRILIE